MNLVNYSFDGKEYQGWKKSFLIAFSAKKKLGIIDGTCKAPEITAADYEQWACCNDIVISWIRNALSCDIANSVIYSKTAKQLWDSLETQIWKI